MARKRSRFVPRAVFGAGFGSVVPACVIVGIQACGTNTPPPGVAAVAYCCFDAAAKDGEAGDATITDSAVDADAQVDAPKDVTGDAPEGG
jgi:hypothetical protein